MSRVLTAPASAARSAAPTGRPGTALSKAAWSIAATTANAITPKGGAGTRPSAADREQAVAMHWEGVSQSAVARIVCVTLPAVCRGQQGGCRTLSAAAPADGGAGKALPVGNRRR